MKATLAVAGLMQIVMLGVANVHLAALDPNCNKLCGRGTENSDGWRYGCGAEDGCHWALCDDYITGCGYVDNFIDDCSEEHCEK